MLKLSVSLHNVPIYSLRTGHQVGIALRPLLNPKNLKIEAWFAESRFDNGLLLLPSTEIREIGSQGIAINDHDSITPAEELVRLAPLVRLDFQLIGKKVYSERKHKIGKVDDYATDLESYYVQKLYVSPTVFKALTRDQRVISRVQIIEIDAKKIIVKDTEVPSQSFFRAPARAPES